MDLTAEQAAMRDVIREFAHEEVAPLAGEADRTETFPEDCWDDLAALDVTGMTTPEEYGGLAVDRRTYALVNEALAEGMLALATALSVHCLATSCIARFGSDAQCERWLPEMVDGRPVGAFALSEPQAGSNPAEMSTVARREGDSYVLDGTKQWITNGQRAGVVILFAKTDPDDPDSVTQFLVPADSDGLTVGTPEEKMGLRASDTTSLEFDGVEIPADNRLTEEGKGLQAALSILTGGRIGIAAQSVGLAQAALDATIDYVGQREQFGGPIGDIQSVRHTVAEMHANIEAARQATWHAAEQQDAGNDARLAASVAKYLASETAVDVTADAVQLHGGYGYTTDFPVERLYRDAKVTTIYEGTSQIQKTVIARELLD